MKAPAERTNRKKKSKSVLTRTQHARAFLEDFILTNSQFSPSLTLAYLDFNGLRPLFRKYEWECKKIGFLPIRYGGFDGVWRQIFKDGIVNPEDSINYTVHVRPSHAKGFRKCSCCEYWKCKIRGTQNQLKKKSYRRRLDVHIEEVYDDRSALAKRVRKCKVDDEHSGFYIDAIDNNKFQMPTTVSTGKNLSSLWRIKPKLTCIKMWDNDQLYVFRTLPHIRTGANLSGTILFRMAAKGLFDRCSTLHINFDGASDNVAYTVLYTIVHLLLTFQKSGKKLRRIILYRFKVGHTHNALDALFGKLSKIVYVHTTHTHTHRYMHHG